MSRAPCPKCRDEGNDRAGDNMYVYGDGHGFCHSCKTRFNASEIKGGKPMSYEKRSTLTLEQVQTYPPSYDKTRGYSKEVAEHFGVRGSVDTTTGVVDTIYYPYRNADSGAIEGYKVRKMPKEFRPSVGKIGKSFFGMEQAVKPKPYLLLTEGEEDCMAATEMVLANKAFDVMSLPNGASMCAAISDSTDLLMKYKRIYLCLDPDKPGRIATEEIADFIAPLTTVKVVECDPAVGDVGDYLASGNQKMFIKILKDAKEYTPEGVINGMDIDLDSLLKPLPEGYPVPFEGLNDKLHGVRKAEIVTVCAGSGVGKSTMTKELACSLIDQGLKVAIVALEDQMEVAAQSLLAIAMNIPLNKFRFHPPTKAEVEPFYKKYIASGNVYFYKHFAGINAPSLMNKLYYYAKSEAVDFIILDHLSMVISATESNNERKDIDTLMTNLAKMVVETGVGLIQVVHLKRSGGDKSFAKGGEVELTDLRGSAALEQMSWTVIGMERDQQGEDSDFSKVRVLKNRTFGFTGIADTLKFDTATGRLKSVPPTSLSPADGDAIGEVA
mgnify:FL=1|jgi:twinkle protein